MTTQLFLFILIIHFLADFVLQTHWQAANKSTNNKALLYHCSTYSLTWLFSSYIVFGNISNCIIFAIVTFIIHFITDYITSRQVKKFFDKKNYHDGFVMIGFDQILHYLQLYLTFELLL